MAANSAVVVVGSYKSVATAAAVADDGSDAIAGIISSSLKIMTLACDVDPVTFSVEDRWFTARGAATVFEFSHVPIGTSTRILFSAFGDISELDVRSLLLLSFSTAEDSVVWRSSVVFGQMLSGARSLKSFENSNCIRSRAFSKLLLATSNTDALFSKDALDALPRTCS